MCQHWGSRPQVLEPLVLDDVFKSGSKRVKQHLDEQRLSCHRIARLLRSGFHIQPKTQIDGIEAHPGTRALLNQHACSQYYAA